MLKQVLSALLIISLALPACASVKIPFKSIQHLADIHEDGKIHEICTTWATRVSDNSIKWVSAAHCIIPDSEGKPDVDAKYKIAGKDAQLIRWDLEKDLAMWSGPNAQPLQIAYYDAEVGDPVYTFAYFWVNGGLYTQGIASGDANVEGFKVWALPAGPGASGAPIMIKGNIVVGVVQFGPSPFPSPVMAGVGVDLLRQFVLGW